MTTSSEPRTKDPAATLSRLRTRVLGGGCPPLEDLGEDDMVAAQVLIAGGEAEIVNRGCHPFLVAKLQGRPASGSAGAEGLLAALARTFEGKRRPD